MRRMPSAGRTLGVVLFSAALAVFLFLDVIYAISAYWGVVGLVATMLCASSWILAQKAPISVRLATMVICCASAVGIRYVDWDSRKPFLRHLLSIRLGMTRSDVESVMASYIRVPEVGGDRMRAPGVDAMPPEESVAYRHTSAGWGDSDVGVVHLVDGGVVAVEFFPD